MGYPVTGTSALTIALTERPASGITLSQGNPFGAVGTTYTAGTGANQVNLLHFKQYTLAAAPTTINLRSILDVSGATVTMQRVREMFVSVQDTNATHVLNIYAAASNGWSFLPPVANQLTTFPSGESAFYMTDPQSVGAGNGLFTGSSSHDVVLDPGANTVVVNVLISGCDALS